jgi:hypothetical protein
MRMFFIRGHFMYQVFKRRGSRVELLPQSPIFSKLEAAIAWASEFFKANPTQFQYGLEAIEVRRAVDRR